MSMNLSRRSFMKGAAALAAVSAMSGVLAGCSTQGGVSGVGATRTFGNSDSAISLASTDFDIVSVPGATNVTVIPAFTVVNSTKLDLKITGTADDFTDGAYTLVVTATFDGKLPAAKPTDLPKYETNIDATDDGVYTSDKVFGSLTNLTSGVSSSKTVDGVLCFTAPFKNWRRMDMDMVLYYKKDSDTAAQKVGSTTFTFKQ